MFVNDLNEHETVYGGRLLELLDGSASISASRLARVETVTASIDQLNFIAPFKMQDSLCIESYVSGAGHRSVEIFTKIIGEHLKTGERFLGLTAFLTFVTIDKNVVLPSIEPLTAEEKFICQGYAQRKANRLATFQTQKEFNAQINLEYPWDHQF
ncbi:thioesterase superfamily protein [Latilactobacillus fuchuensis DSM 14340 = JCM 11249]|uniref:Thioesterase superfamily protein n=1 Tax=Latilactobacillus fuchuensis DSM 14340 = JCM 11249 TaxID=1423747 RepID=A0A0R1RWW7_9LACO|nr:thioesterase superfamily protein [Latilactobacillus fuchuensis DSM 14340 = JCM 11249]